MSLHRKMIILRLLHPRHIVQPIHKIHRRMYLRDSTVLSVCSRQIRCRNSLLLFGKPPQYHCLNIFPMVSNQEFEYCQYSHHYSFHHSRQEQSFPIHFRYLLRIPICLTTKPPTKPSLFFRLVSTSLALISTGGKLLLYRSGVECLGSLCRLLRLHQCRADFC